MKRTIIQKYSSALIHGLSEEIKSLHDVNHNLTKGELRELFVSRVLNHFLTKQFEIGSGIIINQAGMQSTQTDIIIYDNRVIPPFIKEQNLGIYPAESVLCTIEVKSNLRKSDLLKTERNSQKLLTGIYSPKFSIYDDFNHYKPITAIIGFSGAGVKELKNSDTGKSWLNANIKSLFAICLLNKYSWIKTQGSWKLKGYIENINDETKRFIAVLLDNIRTISEKRWYAVMKDQHKDWLGAYIRDQGLFINE